MNSRLIFDVPLLTHPFLHFPLSRAPLAQAIPVAQLFVMAQLEDTDLPVVARGLVC